jgi:hypothetical protein
MGLIYFRPYRVVLPADAGFRAGWWTLGKRSICALQRPVAEALELLVQLLAERGDIRFLV